MILSDRDILEAIASKQIVIEPFHMEQLNPNSYNLCLGPEIAHYSEVVLDPKVRNRMISEEIPTDGYILIPNRIYLAATIEWTATHGLVPQIEGRSSVARLGISVHTSAGFGDNGFCGRWTLELSVSQRAKVYAGMQIAQIFYHAMSTSSMRKYDGKYQNSEGIVGSRLWMEN